MSNKIRKSRKTKKKKRQYRYIKDKRRDSRKKNIKTKRKVKGGALGDTYKKYQDKYFSDVPTEYFIVDENGKGLNSDNFPLVLLNKGLSYNELKDIKKKLQSTDDDTIKKTLDTLKKYNYVPCGELKPMETGGNNDDLKNKVLGELTVRMGEMLRTSIFFPHSHDFFEADPNLLRKFSEADEATNRDFKNIAGVEEPDGGAAVGGVVRRDIMLSGDLKDEDVKRKIGNYIFDYTPRLYRDNRLKCTQCGGCFFNTRTSTAQSARRGTSGTKKGALYAKAKSFAIDVASGTGVIPTSILSETTFVFVCYRCKHEDNFSNVKYVSKGVLKIDDKDVLVSKNQYSTYNKYEIKPESEKKYRVEALCRRLVYLNDTETETHKFGMYNYHINDLIEKYKPIIDKYRPDNKNIYKMVEYDNTHPPYIKNDYKYMYPIPSDNTYQKSLDKRTLEFIDREDPFYNYQLINKLREEVNYNNTVSDVNKSILDKLFNNNYTGFYEEDGILFNYKFCRLFMKNNYLDDILKKIQNLNKKIYEKKIEAQNIRGPDDADALTEVNTAANQQKQEILKLKLYLSKLIKMLYTDNTLDLEQTALQPLEQSLYDGLNGNIPKFNNILKCYDNINDLFTQPQDGWDIDGIKDKLSLIYCNNSYNYKLTGLLFEDYTTLSTNIIIYIKTLLVYLIKISGVLQQGEELRGIINNSSTVNNSRIKSYLTYLSQTYNDNTNNTNKEAIKNEIKRVVFSYLKFKYIVYGTYPVNVDNLKNNFVNDIIPNDMNIDDMNIDDREYQDILRITTNRPTLNLPQPADRDTKSLIFILLLQTIAPHYRITPEEQQVTQLVTQLVDDINNYLNNLENDITVRLIRLSGDQGNDENIKTLIKSLTTFIQQKITDEDLSKYLKDQILGDTYKCLHKINQNVEKKTGIDLEDTIGNFISSGIYKDVKGGLTEDTENIKSTTSFDDNDLHPGNTQYQIDISQSIHKSDNQIINTSYQISKKSLKSHKNDITKVLNNNVVDIDEYYNFPPGILNFLPKPNLILGVNLHPYARLPKVPTNIIKYKPRYITYLDNRKLFNFINRNYIGKSNPSNIKLIDKSYSLINNELQGLKGIKNNATINTFVVSSNIELGEPIGLVTGQPPVATGGGKITHGGKPNGKPRKRKSKGRPGFEIVTETIREIKDDYINNQKRVMDLIEKSNKGKDDIGKLLNDVQNHLSKIKRK